MRNFASLAACVFAGGAICVPAWAQPATGPSATPSEAAQRTAPGDLGASIDAAWQRAVLARESDGQRRRAAAERTAARSWSAGSPSLELGHRDDRLQADAGARESELGLVWPLWLPGQRAAAGAAADAGIAAAEAVQRAARLRIAGEVREAVWTVLAHRAEAGMAEAHARTLQQLSADVERRVRAGDLARADALAARAEHLAADAQQADAQQRLAAAQARWKALTGLETIPDLVPDGDPPIGTDDRLADHPELLFARLASDHARKRVELARTVRRDAPELLLGVRQDVPARGEPARNSMLVRLRIPFGTDARNEPLDAAAQSELEVAQTSEQRVRDRLIAELSIARGAAAAAERQGGAERERALMLRERAVLIDRSFRAGETPLPDLLRALSAAAQADAALARQDAALGLARARLRQALGLLP